MFPPRSPFFYVASGSSYARAKPGLRAGSQLVQVRRRDVPLGVAFAAVRLEGIHHVTCITADAPGNVDFYARLLGLRLVKKTVNQDDPTVYHLFYADENGTPGSDITFFEYPGVRHGRAGAGNTLAPGRLVLHRRRPGDVVDGSGAAETSVGGRRIVGIRPTA